jgi:phosphate transport system substrate-binding protein
VIKIDGSSTVYPITNAFVADYGANQANKQQTNPVKVALEVFGTTGGFRKFCKGQTTATQCCFCQRRVNDTNMQAQTEELASKTNSLTA